MLGPIHAKTARSRLFSCLWCGTHKKEYVTSRDNSEEPCTYTQKFLRFYFFLPKPFFVCASFLLPRCEKDPIERERATRATEECRARRYKHVGRGVRGAFDGSGLRIRALAFSPADPAEQRIFPILAFDEFA